MIKISLKLIIVMMSFSMGTLYAQDQIIHDAEYYILKAQHGDQWEKQDKEIQKKLADLEKKHGRKPNIVHIMWDDSPVGELGIPHLQKNRGFETPNCPSSNKWNRGSDYLVESFVPRYHVTRHAAGSANDVSRWSSS
jgi:hypothetical protein